MCQFSGHSTYSWKAAWGRRLCWRLKEGLCNGASAHLGVLGPHVRSMHTLQTHQWRGIYDLGAHLLRVDHYNELLPRQLQFVAEHLGWEHRGGSVVVCPNGIIDFAWGGTEAIAQAAEQDWLRMLGSRDAVDISHT